MRSAAHMSASFTLASRRAHATSAPRPTTLLLLSIGSLLLPLRIQCTG